MSQTAELQKQIDAIAMRRTYWRDMLNMITAPQTRDFMVGYRERIKARLDAYTDKVDATDATDSISIAAIKEGRKFCNELLLELNEETCQKTIKRLDDQQKPLKEKMNTVVKKKDNPQGFENLG
jgi:translation elongation factor EF-G